MDNNPFCFACGPDNEWGLKLKFKNIDGKAVAEFTPDPHYQGYRDIVHGGIITTILDESMVYAAIFRGEYVFTAKIEVRFKKPMPVGEKYTVEAEVLKIRRNLVDARAKILDKDGKIVAEGKGVFWSVRENGK